MGWLMTVMGAFAALLLYQQGQTVLCVLAVASAIGTFWTHGVMHNYAYHASLLRMHFSADKSRGIGVDDADAAPNSWTIANFVCVAISFALLIFALVIMI